jgi:hypothetical protein
VVTTRLCQRILQACQQSILQPWEMELGETIWLIQEEVTQNGAFINRSRKLI